MLLTTGNVKEIGKYMANQKHINLDINIAVKNDVSS